MVAPRHETPKESFQLSEGVIPAFAATDARAPRPDVKKESFAIAVVAVARDLDLARGKKVLCHIRSGPPADPPQSLSSERTAGKSSCTIGLYELPIFSATSVTCCTQAQRSAQTEEMVLVETKGIEPSTFALRTRRSPS